MIYVIVSIVIFLSCTIGATVGLGGGVIIKPVLDSMNFASVDVVNFISSFAVFAMSISSMIRHKIQNTKFDKKAALLVSFGAVGGGFIGNRLFRLFLDAVGSETVVIFQAVMIILFVGFAVYYVNKKNAKTFKVTDPFGIILTGLALGSLNSFLGIGGGPINITVLFLMFSLVVKQGAVYSICVVFFCQLSNLLTLFCTNQFKPYGDFIPVVVCGVVSAVIGGLLGSVLNKKFSEKTVRIVFTCVMAFVFGINVYNIIRGIF